MQFLRALAATYVGLLRRFGSVLLVLAMAAGASFVVVYPLWLFATTNRRAYTVAVLVLLGIGFAGLVVSRVAHRIRTDQSYVSRKLLPAIRTAATVGALLVGVYGTIWLYARAQYGVAIPLTLLLATGVGLLGRATR